MTRKDYLDDANAPRANSIAVACSVFVQDSAGRILAIQRTDNGLYSIPGGQLEPGETLTECGIRETYEETGVQVRITGLVGLFSNPNHVIEYDDGEVRQEFSICFKGVPIHGSVRPSAETAEALWLAAEELSSKNFHPSTMLRIRLGIEGGEPYFT